MAPGVGKVEEVVEGGRDRLSGVALQASPWTKSTMGAYYTRFRKLALWVGYTMVAELEIAAC